MLLFLFFITILAVLFFRSSLSRISEIRIEGNEMLTSAEIGQAAAVQAGDHFFAVNTESVRQKVAALHMVQTAEVTKHFPGELRVVVHEYPRVAFQIGADGSRQAVLADGSAVAVPDEDIPVDKPILTGWSDKDPNRKALCLALSAIPAGYLSDISEIRPDPSEAYGDKIKIYTRSKFEVITTVGYLPDKIKNLSAYITSMQESKVTSGVLVLLETDDHLPGSGTGTGDKDAKVKAPKSSNSADKQTEAAPGKASTGTSTGTSTGKSSPPPDQRKTE